MRVLSVRTESGGMTVEGLFYEEFPVRIGEDEYCALVGNYRRILSEIGEAPEGTKRFTVEIGGRTALCLERNEAARFLREFRGSLNSFLLANPGKWLWMLWLAGGSAAAGVELVPHLDECWETETRNF